MLASYDAYFFCILKLRLWIWWKLIYFLSTLPSMDLDKFTMKLVTIVKQAGVIWRLFLVFQLKLRLWILVIVFITKNSQASKTLALYDALITTQWNRTKLPLSLRWSKCVYHLPLAIYWNRHASSKWCITLNILVSTPSGAWLYMQSWISPFPTRFVLTDSYSFPTLT